MADLTETILADVAASGISAEDWARNVAVDPSAIKEVLSMFSNLSEEQIADVLRKHGSSVDASLVELFALHDEVNRKHVMAAKAKEEEKKRKQLQDTARILQSGFAGIPKQVIDEVVARNNGEMERASEELLHILEEQVRLDEKKLFEEQTKLVHEKREKEKLAQEKLIVHCVNTFDVLSREEVTDVLRSHKYDLNKAAVILEQKSKVLKLRNVKHIFVGSSEEHLRKALEACDWDVPRTFALLSGQQVPEVVVEPLKPLEQVFSEAIEQPALSNNPEAKAMLTTLLREQAGPGQNGAKREKKEDAPAVPSTMELEGAADGEAPPGDSKWAITTNAVQFGFGDSVAVEVVTTQEVSAYDWLGVFMTYDQTNLCPLSWIWYKHGEKNLLSFPSYGTFEVRLLRKVNGSFLCLARSEKLLVGPKVTLQVDYPHIEDSVNVVGSAENWTVRCIWDDSLTSAWVGLFATGAPNEGYLAFSYLEKGKPLVFKARQQNGSYEFRFFPYKYQGPLAVSERIIVKRDASITLTREGAETKIRAVLPNVDPKGCWIALCFKNDSRPNHYRRYAYFNTPVQDFVFKTPIHTGLYEARIYDKSSHLLAVSNDMNVVGI